MPDISTYLDLIRHEDFGGIEFARDDVRDDQELVAALAGEYRKLDTWEARSLVIQLVQDATDADVLRPVMQDFLRAKIDGGRWSDHLETTKAIAVCFLDEDFETFPHYLADRTALREAVQRHLAEQDEQMMAAPDVGEPELP